MRHAEAQLPRTAGHAVRGLEQRDVNDRDRPVPPEAAVRIVERSVVAACSVRARISSAVRLPRRRATGSRAATDALGQKRYDGADAAGLQHRGMAALHVDDLDGVTE